mmetsp:Transcript_116019/g.374749  ORF Transcript_116019/g.374749 Transcript_116019/m.374749 type:complete len:290 (-) Transcript_116019:2447-3316(-)
MKRSFLDWRMASNLASTSSISLRATSASRDAACTFSAIPCICSVALKLGMRRFSSTRKRSSSERYSSSSILAAGPTEAACFSSGSEEKSTAIAPELLDFGDVCVGALAGWLGSATRSCSASRPPCSRGTSTSSSTLCLRTSARALPSVPSSEPTSLIRFSTPSSWCRFSLASLRKRCNARSLARSTSWHSLARAWSPLSCASSSSAPCASVPSFWPSSWISAWSLGSSTPPERLACSLRVCSSISTSACKLRSRRASSSARACVASCSRLHSRSSFRTSSTPMAALSFA